MPKRAKVSNYTRDKKLIALPLEKPLNNQKLVNVLWSLLDVIIELNLKTISIAKTRVLRDVPLQTIKEIMKDLFSDLELALKKCNSLVRTPKLNEIDDIIEKYHSSRIVRHKKTIFENSCKTCQMKKMTREKPKRPIIITNTPGSAFGKVALLIMGPLLMTKRRNLNILTMQCLLTKYSRAVPLASISSIVTADAFFKGDCYAKQRQLETTRTYIQMLQFTEYLSIPVLQCKIVLTRMIQYCGMHSPVSAVSSSLAEYLWGQTQQQCQHVHNTETLNFGNNIN
ncbi:hypothetical protein M0804_013815 [Polistes exclamans]|nr:hypothetical protein M0804_013815 [Polistes exclamans]